MFLEKFSKLKRPEYVAGKCKCKLKEKQSQKELKDKKHKASESIETLK